MPPSAGGDRPATAATNSTASVFDMRHMIGADQRPYFATLPHRSRGPFR